jgi:hypothetical protein
LVESDGAGDAEGVTMSARDGHDIPNHIPPELQRRYGEEARARVRATARRRGGTTAGGNRAPEPADPASRIPRIVLIAGAIVTAVLTAALAFSWVAAMVVVVTVMLLAAITVPTRTRRTGRGPPGAT